MTGAAIPDDVQRFVLLAIPSVPYLEALLLMRGSPALPWNCVQIGQRLYLNDKVAARLLAELLAAGVITAHPEQAEHYLYQPHSLALASNIDRLAAVYATNLIPISHLIHSKINKKAQQFADAFVFRKGN